MKDRLKWTEDRIEEILCQRESITLSQLETAVDTGYNLLFLALDRMTAEKKVRLEKKDRDYILSLPQEKH
jgi:hypothetical protein